MKRLIVCIALLLISATPLPSHPPEADKFTSAAGQEYRQPNPGPTDSYQASPSRPTENRNSSNYYYYYPSAKSEGPPIWFQVVATITVIIFTAGLWLTSIWQWQAIKEQANIAKRVLTELEVPYVSIGEIIPHVFRVEDGRKVLHPNIPITFEFSLKNHGRAVAEIISVHSELRVVGALPPFPEYSGTVEPSGGFPIGPHSDTGKVRWFPIYQCPSDKVEEEFLSLFGGYPKIRLVCFGYINYRDPSKTNWKSGFAWVWYPHSDGAFLVGGSNYNYNRKNEPYAGAV